LGVRQRLRNRRSGWCTRAAAGSKALVRGSGSLKRRSPDPAPRRGLGLSDFRRICDNGFGDGHNSFPHSAEWYKGCLYIGTTRSNFQMLKIQSTFKNLPVALWPVEGPDDAEGLYRDLDRRAQIW